MATDTAELFSHVQDANSFHFPGGGHLDLPNFGTIEVLGRQIELQVTKFMVLELVAAAIMLAIFIPLAIRIRGGRLPRGRLWNMLELMLLFLRDEVARPAIGRKDADRFLPFIWTVFFFVLFCKPAGVDPLGPVRRPGRLP